MNRHPFTILLGKELIGLVRSRKLLIGLAVFVFFSLVSPLTARYMPEIIGMVGNTQGITIQLQEPVYTDSLVQLVNNLGQIGLFVLIFLIMGIVVQEKEEGAAAFLLVKPISRTGYMMAKFTAIAIFVASLLTVAYAICGLYTGLLFGVYPWRVLLGVCATLLVYILSILSVTLLMSTVSKSQAAAGVLSLVVWVFLSLLSKWQGPGAFLFGSLLSETQGQIFSMPVDWRPYFGAVVLIVGSVAAAVGAFRRWEA